MCCRWCHSENGVESVCIVASDCSYRSLQQNDYIILTSSNVSCSFCLDWEPFGQSRRVGRKCTVFYSVVAGTAATGVVGYADSIIPDEYVKKTFDSSVFVCVRVRASACVCVCVCVCMCFGLWWCFQYMKIIIVNTNETYVLGNWDRIESRRVETESSRVKSSQPHTTSKRRYENISEYVVYGTKRNSQYGVRYYFHSSLNFLNGIRISENSTDDLWAV